MPLNLAGVLLGNPSINAVWEYKLMPRYAYENRLISEVGIFDVPTNTTVV